MQIFKEVLFFQATYNIKTEKQTIQLILCHLDAWRLVGGKGHETVNLVPFCFRLSV